MLIHDIVKLMNGNNLPQISELVKNLIALILAIRELIDYLVDLFDDDGNNKDAKPR